MAAIHTRNILKVYRQASPAQIEAGMTWYDYAHNIAWVIGRGNALKGAGIVAAFSPLTPWWRNEILAIDSANRGIARTDTLGNSSRAAQRIIDGEDPLVVLKGIKTNNFARNIASAGKGDAVTVDVHAYSIAMGKQTFSSNLVMGKRLYNEIAESYRRAAKRAGISPTQMQAITWVVWRDMHPNKAARKDLPVS